VLAGVSAAAARMAASAASKMNKQRHRAASGIMMIRCQNRQRHGKPYKNAVAAIDGECLLVGSMAGAKSTAQAAWQRLRRKRGAASGD